MSIWSMPAQGGRLPVIELCGDERPGKRAIAAAASAMLGLQLHAITAWALPHTGAAELGSLMRLWEREAILNSSALMVECDDAETPESLPPALLTDLMETVRSPLFLSTRTSRQAANRAVMLFDVTNPTAREQAQIWHDVLEPEFPAVNGEVEALVSQFSLNPPAICAAAGQVIGSLRSASGGAAQGSEEAAGLGDRLWDACRVQARPRLEASAPRPTPPAAPTRSPPSIADAACPW